MFRCNEFFVKKYQLLSVLLIICMIMFNGCKDDVGEDEIKTPKFERKEYMLGSTDSITVKIYARDSLKQLSYGSYYVSKIVSTVNCEESVVDMDVSQDVISENWYLIRKNTDGTLFVKFMKNDVLSEKKLEIHIETEKDGSGFFAIIIVGDSCHDPTSPDDVKIVVVPEPLETNVYRGALSLTVMPINVDITFGDISNSTDMLRALMQENLGNTTHNGDISFNIIHKPELEEEGYELLINGVGIQLSASSKKGVFYGIQTFSQLLLSAVNNKIPYLTIKDKPRFSYRGLMLDPARHFIPINEIKKFIDIMAFYKYNHLHLHLTDHEGWTVKIEGLSRFNQPALGSPLMGPGGGRGIYTKEELKDLVAFASDRGVELIPEIDIPGHSAYIVSLYPELNCGILGTYGQLCASSDAVLDFLDIVISEIAEIFPSPTIHLGGDEFSIECVKACNLCQSKMTQLGYEKEEQLLAYLFENANKILEKYGKAPMFWHEPDIPDYSSKATLYSWRLGAFKDALAASKKNGCKIICSPDEYSYFNYPQAWEGEPPFDNWGMPAITLSKVYSFEPTFNFEVEEVKNLIGIEALLWNEYITSIDLIYYMMFPRAIAFAEVGWSTPENKSWNHFYYDKLGFHYNYLTTKKDIKFKIVL